MQDNIIEFNGKRYDALTGKLLGKSQTEVAEPLASAPITGRTLDGVVRRRPEPAAKDRAETIHPPKKPAAHPKTHRQPGKTVKPHHPQIAKTLMRRSVQKPSVTPKPAIKPHVPAEVKAKPISGITVKRSAQRVDPQREHRASRTPKSHTVQRFPASPEHHHIMPTAAPKPAQSHATTPQPNATPHHQPAKHHKTDIFEAAIARANSHEQPPHEHHAHKRKRRKATGLLAGIAAFLILGGFFTYLNLPKIELKIASVSAGFSAHLPSHTPLGYELTDVQNRPGQVTLSFRSGSKNYQLSQQPTDWSSQTLQDNIAAGTGHETIEVGGRIVYIYNNAASWISGDVRYDLTGNAEFDADEIAEIASST